MERINYEPGMSRVGSYRIIAPESLSGCGFEVVSVGLSPKLLSIHSISASSSQAISSPTWTPPPDS